MGLFCENILVCTNYEGQEIQTASQIIVYPNHLCIWKPSKTDIHLSM